MVVITELLYTIESCEKVAKALVYTFILVLKYSEM